ncbi:hypothetical protein BKA65DRAFT_551206 [Rhexocercosporidium sp. MPI-PUGE-AT-0058]|nr:hypothetical protein BKA65DRAFT_551206 [Rhexocercosporidium sp. MPI-PUGE-AT-0058]
MAAFLPPGIESMFPPCSLDCVAGALDSEPGIALDFKLLCAHPPVEKTLADCVRGSCSFPDQQKVGTKNNDLCKDQPVGTKVAMATSILGALGVITNVTVGLRIYTRMKLARGIGLDDYLIIAASAVLGYVQISGTVEVIAFGLGKHTFNVAPKFHLPNLYLYWSDEISYQIVITLTKCSILCFYLKLFPDDRFRATCYGMLVVTIVTGLGFLLVTIFQCKPIRGVFDKSVSSKCLDVNALTYASGAMSIAIDFAILIMPIPRLLALRVPRRQRNTVLFLFSFGLIASVISIARLPFIIQYGKTTDPLFDNIGPGIWTISEMASAIIAACLPTLKPLVAKVFPRFFSDEYNISNPQQQDTSHVQHPQQQQVQQDRRRGQLSQEFDYLFSHASDPSWMLDEESFGTQPTHDSDGTQNTRETNETNATLQSQNSQRKYFDLKDGKIVQVNNRFSALSIGFVTRYRDDSKKDLQK